MYKIIQNRKIWLSISSLFVVISLVLLLSFGLKLGIDFTGGSILEIRYDESIPSVAEVQDRLSSVELSSLVIQPVGADGMLLRFQEISEEKHQEVISALKNIEGEISFEEMRFEAVGPSIGQELKKKSIYATLLVLLAIVAYIAWVFRRVSKPIASWKYGIVANIALFHDVIITLGVFAILGKYFGVEINTPFVAAILTVLGYSVNDTIVVFDRIRENLPISDADFEDTVNKSVNQTVTRSINTSMTTLLVLVSVLIFGGETIRSFVLALTIGIGIGTYSSIFLASPLLVVWERFRK
ncbi:MAG: protein translocase subunit SecF [Patescibacteria group bacterium]|jgi:preprotein translocase subunit SecF|nr:protein translocase subunit SecF [Patescibacteria group bacterium]